MGLIYFIMILAQFNLLNKPYDQHIGNMTAYRIAGLSYREIAVRWPFFALYAVFLSVYQDIFKERILLQKTAHVVITSLVAPLLYEFMLALGFSSAESLCASLIYVVAYNLPVTLNFLVQPEHYEHLFFLSGTIIVLKGVELGSVWVVAAGGCVLGMALLCKVPALSMWWFLAWFYWKHFSTEPVFCVILAAASLFPAMIFHGQRLVFVEAWPLSSGTMSLWERFFAQFKQARGDGQQYIKDNIITPLYSHLLELMPIIFLACLFFVFDRADDKSFFIAGFWILPFIFIVRFGFWYSQSIVMLLCMMAGPGFVSLLAIHSTPFFILLCLLVLVGCLRIYIYAPGHWIITRELLPFTDDALLASAYIYENSSQFDMLLVNISGPFTYLYTLSQRALSREFPILIWSRPEILRRDAKRILASIAANPPRFVLCKAGEPTIIGLLALKTLVGLEYIPKRRFGLFVLYEFGSKIEAVGGASANIEDLLLVNEQDLTIEVARHMENSSPAEDEMRPCVA